MLDVARLVREQIAALELRLRQAVRNLITFTQIAASTSTGQQDRAEGRPTEEGSYSPAARRMQHAGFRSRARAGADLVVVHPEGGAASGVSIAEDLPKVGPQSLAEGATAIFGTGAASGQVVCDEAGAVKIDAAATKKIELNGNGKGMARLGDTVDAGGYVFTPGPPAVFTYFPPNALPNPLPPGFVPLQGVINSASPDVETD